MKDLHAMVMRVDGIRLKKEPGFVIWVLILPEEEKKGKVMKEIQHWCRWP